MDPMRMYDYLLVAWGKLLDWMRPLDAAQYAREFPFGLKSLNLTLPHIINAEWAYVHRFSGLPLPPREQRPLDADKPPPFATAEAAWRAQAERTRAAINAVQDWGTPLEYTVDWDGVKTLITASPNDIFSQLVIHEVHHRAQAMAMLRQLGIAAEDLDYNTLMYTRRKV